MDDPSSVVIAERNPDLARDLDRFVTHARALLDLSRGVEPLFQARFSRRGQANNLLVASDDPGAVVSALDVRTSQVAVRALLVTHAVRPQYWRVDVGGMPIAKRIVPDRTSQLRQPGAQPPSLAATSPWHYDQPLLMHPLLDVAAEIEPMLAAQVAQAADAAEAWLAEASSPEFRAEAARLRQALLARQDNPPNAPALKPRPRA